VPFLVYILEKHRDLIKVLCLETLLRARINISTSEPTWGPCPPFFANTPQRQWIAHLSGRVWTCGV